VFPQFLDPFELALAEEADELGRVAVRFFFLRLRGRGDVSRGARLWMLRVYCCSSRRCSRREGRRRYWGDKCRSRSRRRSRGRGDRCRSVDVAQLCLLGVPLLDADRCLPRLDQFSSPYGRAKRGCSRRLLLLRSCKSSVSTITSRDEDRTYLEVET
jgi:hypothetical protein